MRRSGWSAGRSGIARTTELALEELSVTQAALAEVGLTMEGRIIHYDQDILCTGYRWLYEVLINDRARISYSENGAKRNKTLESFFGRFKMENQSLFHGAMNIYELRRVIARQIDYHNQRRRHSRLENTAPMDYVTQEGILPEPVLGLAVPST